MAMIDQPGCSVPPSGSSVSIPQWGLRSYTTDSLTTGSPTRACRPKMHRSHSLRNYHGLDSRVRFQWMILLWGSAWCPSLLAYSIAGRDNAEEF
jgi:hypothetical protein